MKRFIRYTTLLSFLFFAVLCAYIVHLSVKDYSYDFVERKGALSNVHLTPAGGDSLTEKSWLTITNTDGFKVKCGVLAPRDSLRRYPAIVLLGGKATGKNAIDFALGIENVIIVAVDYPLEQRERYSLPQFLADTPEIRQALLDMVPSVMLVIDYLLTRSDIDTTKIVILGYSFGAPFVPCIVAHEKRIAVAAMVYGAGDLRSLIRHNVRRYEGELMSEFVGILGGMLLSPLEPMRYIERVSPTPLIMINGTNDEMIPRVNVEALYAAAKEPKKIWWIDSKHVNPREVKLTKAIIAKLRAELVALGVFDAGASK